MTDTSARPLPRSLDESTDLTGCAVSHDGFSVQPPNGTKEIHTQFAVWAVDENGIVTEKIRDTGPVEHNGVAPGMEGVQEPWGDDNQSPTLNSDGLPRRAADPGAVTDPANASDTVEVAQ